MKEREEATKQGKTTKKKMWIDITEELAKHGFNFTWEQVKGKWATLIAALKRTNDHNNRSGADKKTCTFQKELQEILHKNPSIQPVATSETSILKSGSKRKLGEAIAPLPDLSDDNTDSVESKDTNQPPKSEKCKRKSGSSEVIDFLKQYVDEQKKR